MRLRNFESTNFKTTRKSHKERQKAPRCSHKWWTHWWQRWTKHDGKGKIGFRLDEPSVAYADDIVVLATLQQALEQMILDLREGFKEIGPRNRPCENKLELNAQAKGTMAASGGRKSGMDKN